MSRPVTCIAALYDIHGNLPALEAVLGEVAAAGVDLLVVGGDVVPGPMPAGCLASLRASPVSVQYIKGNGEHDLVALWRGEEVARVPDRYRETMHWVAEQLSTEDLEWMARWPATLQLEVEGLGEVLFCHATPRDDNEIFTELTPEERLRPVFEGVGADLVVCGHTHMQFDRMVGSVRVLNAGSVGMPFGEAGAYWMLVGPDGVQPRRTKYDLPEATRRIAATGFPLADDIDLAHPPEEGHMLERFESASLGQG